MSIRMAGIQKTKIISVDKDVEKKEPSYTVGGNVKWCSHYRKQFGGCSRELKIETPYNPVIPFLDRQYCRAHLIEEKPRESS